MYIILKFFYAGYNRKSDAFRFIAGIHSLVEKDFFRQKRGGLNGRG